MSGSVYTPAKPITVKCATCGDEVRNSHPNTKYCDLHKVWYMAPPRLDHGGSQMGTKIGTRGRCKHKFASGECITCGITE